MNFAIETKSLVKYYKKFRAVHNLNLQVHYGEVYGLLGPNGAGKTTAIKMFCNLLKPNNGEIFLLGKKIPNRSVRSSTGYMPQELALYQGLSVHENISFFGKVAGLSSKQIRKREEELLSLIDLLHWKDTQVQNLSGGMKHRASLACALVHEPELLFLDEPTVGVDPELRISFWDYFKHLKECGITILITTHYMDEARRCDRVGFMRDGHLIAEGVPDDLMRETNTSSLEDAFLKYSTDKAE